ncbi:kinesin-like protein KIF25 [Elephas maximus indicus]|uniref:kinesin-like protein KIF25 n=1 Tax=Elephas maximus indicus TaxID=99487 RepID=UPI002116875E|nr:kinesin-like protein KIF25 [Elephas maximus indicus]
MGERSFPSFCAWALTCCLSPMDLWMPVSMTPPRVYGPAEPQDAVFADVRPLLTSLLDGYNVCIMAYGQTGSGKSYTMLGPQSKNHEALLLETRGDLGVIPKAAEELFRLISENPPQSPEVEVSIVEVYNNEVFDLLAKDISPAVPGAKRDVIAAKEGKKELFLPTSELVNSAAEFMRLVEAGLQLRVKHPTLVHADSSRSHLIITVTLPMATSPDSSGCPSDHTLDSMPTCRSPRRMVREKQRASSLDLPLGAGPGDSPAHLQQVRARLQLVDLAGSECAGMSGVTGPALREASWINRSLAALGDVLGALWEGRGHIPYRNSKLTHLLQDAIGGDAKLLVVLCVSPCQEHLVATLQSLSFGARARQVQRGCVGRRGPPAARKHT